MMFQYTINIRLGAEGMEEPVIYLLLIFSQSE